MWTALFPNWKFSKFYYFTSDAENILKKLETVPFEIKCIKKSPSHKNFILKFLSENSPSFFLKAFIPRPFKKNRIKNYLEAFKTLKNLNVSLLEPVFLFWKNPQIAFLKKEPFYGGIVFPYIEKGFLKRENLFLDDKKENINYKLIKNLIFFLFKLHEKGIYIKDTKFNNFFCDSEENFKIFDLDGIKFYKKPLSKLERLKDLSTLAMSLEWEKITNARALVFDIYKELFSELREKDFEKFSQFVDKKRKKREKALSLRRN
jgi:hypothetical protein